MITFMRTITLLFDLYKHKGREVANSNTFSSHNDYFVFECEVSKSRYDISDNFFFGSTCIFLMCLVVNNKF